jgi:hypothetical protein
LDQDREREERERQERMRMVEMQENMRAQQMEHQRQQELARVQQLEQKRLIIVRMEQGRRLTILHYFVFIPLVNMIRLKVVSAEPFGRIFGRIFGRNRIFGKGHLNRKSK